MDVDQILKSVKLEDGDYILAFDKNAIAIELLAEVFANCEGNGSMFLIPVNVPRGQSVSDCIQITKYEKEN